MDMASLDLGASAGSYAGVRGERLERDDGLPITITEQSYRVTDLPYLTPEDVKDIAARIDMMSKVAVAKGSLVVDSTNRVTEPGPSAPAWAGAQLATYM
ncbi:MAG TPA: hypothetical protein VKD22_11505 [Ramlibacter sp.]|nr:hypothetical protein [Ramlibacter sp.]